MSRAGRVARNTSYLLLSRISVLGIGVATSVLTARYLGANGLGVLGFALAFTGILGILVDFGLGTLTTREVARDRTLASKYLANVVALRLFLGIAFLILVAVFVNFMGYPQETVYVTYVIAGSAVLSSLYLAIAAILQAFEELQYQALGAVLTALVTLCGIGIVIILRTNVVGFAYVYLIANGITLAYFYIIYARRHAAQWLEIDWTFWKHILKEAWPMAALAISVLLYFRIDVIILSLFKGTAQVGLYSVAYNISEAATVLPSMFIASLFPLISQLYVGSKHAFVETCVKSIKYMLYIALPMAFIVTLWAPSIIVLLYGDAFSESAIALQILIWSAAAMYVGIILGTTFVSANLQKLSMKLTMGAVAFNAAINLLIIPQYGFLGASVTTVVTETLLIIADVFFLGRYGYHLHLRKVILPPFFGLAVMLAISVVLLAYSVHVLLITLIAVPLYAIIVYKLGINEEDVQLITGLLKRSARASAET